MRSSQKGISKIVLLAVILIVVALASYFFLPNYLRITQSHQDVFYNPSALPSPSGVVKCSSNNDCVTGMICEQVCAQSYPVKCSPGRCVPVQSNATPSTTGLVSGGGRPGCLPRPECLDSKPRCLIAEPVGGWCK